MPKYTPGREHKWMVHNFSIVKVFHMEFRWWPEPQSLPVAALDSAINLFARIFPAVSARCKLQLLQYFAEQIKLTKTGPRLQALHLNILTTICLSAKQIGERKIGKLDDEQLQQTATNLVLPFLASDSVPLKCLAVETLGRLAQAVSTPQVPIHSNLNMEFFF
jgi:hypothetical protein